MKQIKGITNVKSLRNGSGSIKGIGKEIGKFIITTMEVPWQIVKNDIGGQPEDIIFIDDVDQNVLDDILLNIPEIDSVVGIGGGMAIDAAKYFSWKKQLRLISIPTIVSVDAFLTPAAGVRVNNRVKYVGNSSPDPLIIDYSIIRTAPKTLNIAGVGDLLSIHTASFDWEHADKNGLSEFPFSQDAVIAGQKIIDGLYNSIGEIKKVTNRGIDAIVEGYMYLNTICLPAGHFRIEEGSEHYLFYELEERLQRPFIHGHIVGLGIFCMSQLQKNNSEYIIEFMDSVCLDYHPKDMNINKDDLTASLLNLKNYVDTNSHLWYTIINSTDINEEWIEDIINNLKF